MICKKNSEITALNIGYLNKKNKKKKKKKNNYALSHIICMPLFNIYVFFYSIHEENIGLTSKEICVVAGPRPQ